MPRRNHRPHAPKRRRYEEPNLVPRSARQGGPVPTGPLVLPVGKCGSKLMFTAADAPAALRQAQARRRGERNGHIEKRFYLCSRCSHHHLTSREEWTEKGTE